MTPADLITVSVNIGAYGGYGRFATVFRGCDGEAYEQYANEYADFAGYGEVSLPVNAGDRVTIGVRGGRFRIQPPARVTHYNNPSAAAAYDYINPYVSYDLPRFGIGLGYISGDIPFKSKDIEADDTRLRVTGHVRLDIAANRTFLAASLGENTPLLAGGGLFNMGIGYPVSKTIHLFSALSAGYYDHVGLLQQAQFRLDRRVWFEAGTRLGQSERIFEGSISGGLVWKLR